MRYNLRGFTELENKTGWYEPDRPPSPDANTVSGVIVDHHTAKQAYELGILDEKPQKVKFPPDIETQGGSKQ